MYDMTDNVWEWVTDEWCESARYMHGGSWNTDIMSNLSVAAWRWLNVSDNNHNVGFRCIKSEDPNNDMGFSL